MRSIFCSAHKFHPTFYPLVNEVVLKCFDCVINWWKKKSFIEPRNKEVWACFSIWKFLEILYLQVILSVHSSAQKPILPNMFVKILTPLKPSGMFWWLWKLFASKSRDSPTTSIYTKHRQSRQCVRTQHHRVEGLNREWNLSWGGGDEVGWKNINWKHVEHIVLCENWKASKPREIFMFSYCSCGVIYKLCIMKPFIML